jgi:hypothetical protein
VVTTVLPGSDNHYLELASSRAGDAVALVGTDSELTAIPFDETAPELRDLVVPASAVAGAPVAMSVTGFDALSSAAAPTWDFGDGATATGASPSHTYAAPGSRTVTVSVTDGGGNSVSRTATVAVAPAPLPKDATAPVVTGFGVSNKAFAASRTGARATRARRRGTTFRFKLSEPARVVIRLERALPGVRVGRACKPLKRGRRGRRCTRFRVAGTITRAAKAGRTSLRFSGRLRGRSLAAGRYRATVVATDAARNRSAPRRVTFRMLRR